MLSQIDIINRALSRINAAEINSLLDKTKEGTVARREWEASRDATLREHDWGFASRRVPLAPLAGKPRGYAFAYAEPVDCLMVRRVLPSPSHAADRPTALYVMGVHNGAPAILADVADAEAEYTARVENPGLFDPQFVDALAWKLASVFALAVKGDSESAGTAMQMYEFTLRGAETRNAQESGFDDDEPSTFERARWM